MRLISPVCTRRPSALRPMEARVAATPGWGTSFPTWARGANAGPVPRVPRDPDLAAVQQSGGERGAQPDRVPERGPGDSRALRGRAGQTWSHLAHAGGRLPGSGLRVEGGRAVKHRMSF